MSKSLVISLCITVVAVGLIWFATTKKSQAPTVLDEQAVAVSHCGLTISNPLSGASVSTTSPLSITAIVDNTNMQQAGCSWTVFEAQAGSYELKDQNDAVLGTGVLTTTQDWMTTAPVTYTSQLLSVGAVATGTPLTLVFTEEDVAGLGNPDTLTVPLVAQ